MKKTFSIVKLRFIEPLALMSGQKDEFQDEVVSLSSDTLKAAIISAFAQVVCGNQTEIENLNENLKVSSAYLFYEDTEKNISAYFFPKPYTQLPVISSGNPKENKQLKKIQFIEKEIFEKILFAQTFKLEETALKHSGSILCAQNTTLPEKLYTAQTEERVSIGNTNVFSDAEKGSPFYVSRTYFHKNAGLYFIFESSDNKQLEKALNYLQYQGIGADKTVGNGKFSFEISEITLNLPENADKQLLLSKFIPAQEEISQKLLDNAAYNLSLRGGYLAGTTNESYAHFVKQNIFVIDEGATFDRLHAINGKNVEIINNETRKILGHTVWRDGRPITIPFTEYNKAK